ncbi:fumarate hydratase [Alicyclobacillus acidoterrestris]|uniref:Fumarate hydratase class I n=1 Tax=Alicyclobacillus acidoterrestris (strain ATCC 49025 / DSM 3922 / CIP 106132 / NCIMB 13137 / GD3B) TaxID=1356854 RepID=T0BXR2_ALIAG|nr:fumarate hydratase [Alicyclobacillus acidoterrestris]EPZ45180.1 fumarate hydratase [Alicyclobacillus acidoterrestris ATCC 49025]UNO49926.1 fumarate hydratase [Alicyclobacillus acidoterrestris]
MAAKDSLLQLITETSTNLPPDVRRAIKKAQIQEEFGSRAALALNTIVDNIVSAEEDVQPICQDTGMPTFIVHCPVGFNQIQFQRDIEEAIVEATKLGKLRPNSVDPLTGKNTGNNLGEGVPVVHFHQWERDDVEVKLILKGGGCENKNIQYALPTELPGLGRAGRDLEGVRKCILHAVYQAQGQGCSAGFIGVGIGGDRTSGYDLAKEQLFRPLDDVNPNETLAELENYIMETANRLEIGTMGFGGKVTLLGCKIGVRNRIPASFYVSVAYNCWAFRRLGVVLDPATGEIKQWLYRDYEEKLQRPENAFSTDGAIVLQAPISEEQIRSLKVGDVVLIKGEMHTGRDEIHKYLMKHDAPVNLNGGIIYHCGPVMLQDDDGTWHVKAAGPTTSSREEPYQADIIEKFGIRAVIGKGGMGQKTSDGLKKSGAVYLNAIGGAAQFYANCVKAVKGVDLIEEFGVPEAMWHLEVEGFPAIVTMDAHGNSLHKEVAEDSMVKLEDLKDPVFAS